MNFSNISNEDQQRYIRARFELENLENKQVLSDSEYERAYAAVYNTYDRQQMDDFNDTYISESEYREQKERLEEIINSVNIQDERINEERISYEKHIRAARERDYLKKIKKYYETNNRKIMQQIDIDKLSDDEIIEIYRAISMRFDYETLNEIIGERKNKDSDVVKMNDEIQLFTSDSDRIIDALNKAKGILVLDDAIDNGLNDMIVNIDSDIAKLDESAKKIIGNIDGLRSLGLNAFVAMRPTLINEKVKRIKDMLKDLKRSQIDKYNKAVENTNKKIADLKKMTGLAPEIIDIINELTSLNHCDIDITKWNQINYLNSINYERLKEINDKIALIEEKLNVKKNKINLSDDLDYIDKSLKEVQAKYKEDMKQEELESLKENALVLADNINEFKYKLDANKDKISEDEYNKYLASINDMARSLNEFNKKLVKPDVSQYKKMFYEIYNVEVEIDNLQRLVDALGDNVNDDGLKVFSEELDGLEGKLNDALKHIDEKYNNGELDKVQHDNLVRKYNEVCDKVTNLRKQVGGLDDEEVEKPELSDNLADLIKRIDRLEEGIDLLEQEVNKFKKPIKNKKTKDEFKEIIESIADEMDDIQKQIDKVDNEEDRKKLQDRFDKIQDKYIKVTKDFKRKTPLKVKSSKDAKSFYEKHKKGVLMAVGLASFALFYTVLGHAIIPAIIRANLMMGYKSVAMRPTLAALNNLLGKAIGARQVMSDVTLQTGVARALVWQLSNGAIIDPVCASASLLKGIAISTLGSTVLAAPGIVALVAAIKQLPKQMKEFDLKHGVANAYDGTKEKVAAVIDKAKDSVKEKKEDLSDKIDNKKKNLKRMLNDWIFNSVYDFDDFCDSKGLTDKEREEFKKVLIEKGILSEKDKKRR